MAVPAGLCPAAGRRATNHYAAIWKGEDGLHLYAQGWEPESEPKAVVCLVHGLGDHSGRYGHVAAHLVEHGYALLAVDLRGHGRSAGPRGHAATYEALLQDIDLLLGTAASYYPGRPRFLYGHSLGGGLVISYALSRRPKLAGVVATSPSLRPAIEPPAWKLRLGRLLYNVRPQMQMNNGLDIEGLSHEPAVIRAYRRDPLVHDRVSARLGLDLLSNGEQALGQAARFPLPLLLMHGNCDRLTSFAASRQFAEQAPAGICTFREWDGLYHELHNEPQAGEVLNAITGWLDAHLVAPRRPVAHFGAHRAGGRGKGRKRRRK